MERVIKFRIYNPIGKNLLYDLENVFECLMQQIVFDKSQPTRGFTAPYDHRSDGMVWMQFTGFKDCKGVDIYEGDLIEFDAREWGGNDNIHIVSWDEKDGSWNWGGGATSDMGYRTVIGNIYQSPELLTNQ